MAHGATLVGGMNVLAAIVETGSFARASALLDVSPSGVSRAIARLETHLGVRLMNRTTRSTSLTDEGRRLYERIAPLLLEMQEAADSAGQARATVQGRLRLNVDPLFSRLVLAPRLGEFTHRHPALELEILARDPMGDLVADGFDLAIRFGQPPSSSLVARKLFSTQIITVAAPSYLRRRGVPRSPAEVVAGSHTCIHFRDSPAGRPLPWQFRIDGALQCVATSGPITINDAGTLLSLCVAGYGLAQVMVLGSESLLRDGSLVRVLEPYSDETYPLHAFYPSRRLVPARVAAMLDFVSGLQPPAGKALVA